MVDKLFTNPLIFSILSAILGAILWEVLKFLTNSSWDRWVRRKEWMRIIEETNRHCDSGNYDIALSEYNKLLVKINVRYFPDLYSLIQRGMGLCYLEAARKNKQENGFNLAIGFFENALFEFESKKSILKDGKVIKELKYPLECVKTYILLGVAFEGLSYVRNMDSNLKKAIFHYQNTIDICNQYESQEALSEMYFKSFSNIGICYAKLSEISEKDANLNAAIEYFNKSLKFCDEKTQSDDYSVILIHIGNCYLSLSNVSNILENILKSIGVYSEALTKIENELDVELGKNHICANANIGLGNSYLRLADFPNQNTETCIEHSVNHFNNALKYTAKEEVYKLSEIKNNLALAYRILAKARNSKENLNKARELLEEILQIFNIIDYPLNYANTIYHLAIVNGELAECEDVYDDKKRYSNESISYFDQAKRIFTKEKYLDKYLDICNGLATQYINSTMLGDCKQNLEKSISISKDVISSIKPASNLFAYTKALLNHGIGHINMYQLERNIVNKTEAENNFKEVIEQLEYEKNGIYYEAKRNLDKIFAI